MECEGNTYVDTKVRGGGGALEEGTPLQPVEEPTPEQGDAPEDGRDSTEKPALEQSVPEGLQPIERTHTGAVHGELSPVGETPMLEQGKSEESCP